MAAILAFLVTFLAGTEALAAAVARPTAAPVTLALKVDDSSKLAAAACACAAAKGAPCCACAPVVATVVSASSPTPGASHTQVLFVDEDSDEDAIKEVKGSKKPGNVPEIVSFAGYNGDTLDDLPVVPKEKTLNRKYDVISGSDGEYYPGKPSPRFHSPTDLDGEITFWEISPGASTTVFVRTAHNGLPFVKKIHSAAHFPAPTRSPAYVGSAPAWRPSYSAAPTPNRGFSPSWSYQGDAYPYGRPKPYYPPRPGGSYQPPNAFYPTNNRFPAYPPAPTRPPFVPTTTTAKTVHSVRDKLDWSNESQDDNDKKGTDGKYDGASVEKKVLTAIDKLDLDQLSRRK